MHAHTPTCMSTYMHECAHALPPLSKAPEKEDRDQFPSHPTLRVSSWPLLSPSPQAGVQALAMHNGHSISSVRSCSPCPTPLEPTVSHSTPYRPFLASTLPTHPPAKALPQWLPHAQFRLQPPPSHAGSQSPHLPLLLPPGLALLSPLPMPPRPLLCPHCGLSMGTPK